ncbi:hypothetical protein V1478_002100 [Vespula squamosa]|uniref:Uncharacterized protein n=1 Tax=Vespula squamosa TaxID=30214 RepID=A0ABD2BZL6_VESSQ
MPEHEIFLATRTRPIVNCAQVAFEIYRFIWNANKLSSMKTTPGYINRTRPPTTPKLPESSISGRMMNADCIMRVRSLLRHIHLQQSRCSFFLRLIIRFAAKEAHFRRLDRITTVVPTIGFFSEFVANPPLRAEAPASSCLRSNVASQGYLRRAIDPCLARANRNPRYPILDRDLPPSINSDHNCLLRNQSNCRSHLAAAREVRDSSG